MRWKLILYIFWDERLKKVWENKQHAASPTGQIIMHEQIPGIRTKKRGTGASREDQHLQ